MIAFPRSLSKRYRFHQYSGGLAAEETLDGLPSVSGDLQ